MIRAAPSFLSLLGLFIIDTRIKFCVVSPVVNLRQLLLRQNELFQIFSGNLNILFCSSLFFSLAMQRHCICFVCSVCDLGI
jgi:hypothetical protein